MYDPDRPRLRGMQGPMPRLSLSAPSVRRETCERQCAASRQPPEALRASTAGATSDGCIVTTAVSCTPDRLQRPAPLSAVVGIYCRMHTIYVVLHLLVWCIDCSFICVYAPGAQVHLVYAAKALFDEQVLLQRRPRHVRQEQLFAEARPPLARFLRNVRLIPMAIVTCHDNARSFKQCNSCTMLAIRRCTEHAASVRHHITAMSSEHHPVSNGRESGNRSTMPGQLLPHQRARS